MGPLGGPSKVDVYPWVEVAESNGEKVFPWGGARGSSCGVTAWLRVLKRVSLEEVAWNKVSELDQNV